MEAEEGPAVGEVAERDPNLRTQKAVQVAKAQELVRDLRRVVKNAPTEAASKLLADAEAELQARTDEQWKARPPSSRKAIVGKALRGRQSQQEADKASIEDLRAKLAAKEKAVEERAAEISQLDAEMVEIKEALKKEDVDLDLATTWESWNGELSRLARTAKGTGSADLAMSALLVHIESFDKDTGQAALWLAQARLEEAAAAVLILHGNQIVGAGSREAEAEDGAEGETTDARRRRNVQNEDVLLKEQYGSVEAAPEEARQLLRRALHARFAPY